MPSPPRKKKTGSLSHSWYDGSHYTKTQPFGTFLMCRGKIVKENMDILTKEIRTLVPFPSRATALEIGPGSAPVIAHLPFRESYYLERSPAIAHQLAKESIGKKKNAKTIAHFIVGDVQRLPFSKQARFDLVVMNEVLTHIPPGKRAKVLAHMASRANALLLVERPRPTYVKFLGSLYPEMRQERTPAQLREIYSAYTRIPPLSFMLSTKGWKVHARRVVYGETYCVLTAHRKEKKQSSLHHPSY
ncbi:MAG: class I SAM-dependent methyltransferase [archaeon]